MTPHPMSDRRQEGAATDVAGLSQVEPADAVSPLRASIPSATPIARRVIYFGSPAVVCCDAQCSKAWGIHQRPQISLSDDPDDIAFLADDELGEAPADPGTYEGGCAKPYTAAERLNKWCVRECERSSMSKTGRGDEVVEAPDFSRRRYNMPWLHPEPSAPRDGSGEAGETGTGSIRQDDSAVGGAPGDAEAPKTIDALKKENAELREALRPFAEEANRWIGTTDEAHFVDSDYGTGPTVGDLRRAAQVFLSFTPTQETPHAEG